MTRAVLIGAGAREALAAGGRGRVLAWLRRACYLDMPGGLVAVVPRSVHPGPLHLVVERALPLVPTSAPVRLDGAALRIGHSPDAGDTAAEHAIDLDSARPWRARLPDPAVAAGAGPLLARAATRAGAIDRSALLDPSHRGPLDRFAAALRAGDLAAAAAAVGGLGPGLTPAGDDALAAALLYRRCVDPAAEPGLRSVAASVRTGTVAAALLAWAARGQALAPAHRLLLAAAGGDEAGAVAAARDLAAVGATSGADFCLGLCLAALEGRPPADRLQAIRA